MNKPEGSIPAKPRQVSSVFNTFLEGMVSLFFGTRWPCGVGWVMPAWFPLPHGLAKTARPWHPGLVLPQ